MNLNVDIVQLVSWGSVIRFVGWLGMLFIFWRTNKSDIVPDNLFGLISRLFVFGIIVYVIAYIMLIPVGIAMMIYLVISVKYQSREYKYDPWPALDSLVPALLWFIAVDLLTALLFERQIWQLTEFMCLLAYLMIVYPWSKRNYKIISWYPSGKPGFVALIFIGIWSLVELPFAYFKRPGLYWQDLVMIVCLVTACYYWQKQSGNNKTSEDNLLIKIFTKRRNNVS